MYMKNVLIVEDDPDILELLQIHLKDLGCKTQISSDGETGLQAAIDFPFDLIVLDIMLPGIDGKWKRRWIYLSRCERSD